MAPKKTTLKEIGEMLAHVVKHMATKDDLAGVETRLDRRIDKLDAKLDRLDAKLTKFEEREIDKRLQLEVRVSSIEKHLGLDKRSPPDQRLNSAMPLGVVYGAFGFDRGAAFFLCLFGTVDAYVGSKLARQAAPVISGCPATSSCWRHVIVEFPISPPAHTR
jgi:xanthosine utilization system XapX-like protein